MRRFVTFLCPLDLRPATFVEPQREQLENAPPQGKEQDDEELDQSQPGRIHDAVLMDPRRDAIRACARTAAAAPAARTDRSTTQSDPRIGPSKRTGSANGAAAPAHPRW